MRPDVDGLILEEGNHRSRFLPSVWDRFPKPEAFLEHLKRKAGRPPEHWSDEVRVFRYTAERFGERFGERTLAA